MSRRKTTEPDILKRLSNVYNFQGVPTGWSLGYDVEQGLPVGLGARNGRHDVILVKSVEYLIGIPGENAFIMFGSWRAMLHLRPIGEMAESAHIFQDDVIWASERVVGTATSGAGPGDNYMVFHFPEPGFLVTQRSMYFSWTTDHLQDYLHYIGYNMYYVETSISPAQYARIACSQKPLL